MSSLAKFITGDGVEHEVAVGSPAYDHMVKDGSFQRVITETEAAAFDEPKASATEITESTEMDTPVVEAPVEEAAAAEVKAPAKAKSKK